MKQIYSSQQYSIFQIISEKFFFYKKPDLKLKIYEEVLRSSMQNILIKSSLQPALALLSLRTLQKRYLNIIVS